MASYGPHPWEGKNVIQKFFARNPLRNGPLSRILTLEMNATLLMCQNNSISHAYFTGSQPALSHCLQPDIKRHCIGHISDAGSEIF